MRYEFKLPDIGEGVVEGEVVKWLVADGDQVAAEQPVVEVMTDKATVVIPSPKAGKVVERKGKEGEMIKVHSTLLVLETEGAGASAAPAASAPAAASSKPVAASVAAAAPKPAAAPPPPRAAAVAAPVAAPPSLRAVAPPAPMQAPNGNGHVRATPVTRKIAAEAGIDLTTIAGSGPAGRVLKTDVLSLVGGSNGGAAIQPLAPRTPSGGEERIPLRGLRKRIAEKMQHSKRTAAHFTFVEEVDCTRLVAMRTRINEVLAKTNGGKLSYLPFIIKATIAALKKFPTLNASLDDDTHELVLKHYFNIGVAAATPDGLIVPVIHSADQLNLKELASEVLRLGGDAKVGKSQLPDLQGGTFTITSLGEIGGLFATPIINHPEVAILGVHKMRPTPKVVNGQVVVRDVLWLSCSFDHRVVDGSVGAQFTYEVIKYLEDPELLMLELA